MRTILTTALLVLFITICTQPTAHAVDAKKEDFRITKEQRETIAAVDKGLKFLASIQNKADGSWRNNVGNKLGYRYQVATGGYNKPHMGVTAICCMAFMAAGHTPNRGKYKGVVTGGMKFILRHVDKTGWMSHEGTRMYSHAFCSMFLAEVYGMTDTATTKGKTLRKKLRNAIKFILDSQNSEGSWRYIPHQKESDMSICVCQLQALRAAANVGIFVSHEANRLERNNAEIKKNHWNAIEQAKNYVRQSYIGTHSDAGAFRYQINNDGRSSFALTSAGVVALQSMGEYDSHTYNHNVNGRNYKRTINLRRSVEFIQRNRPDRSNQTSRISPNSARSWCNFGFWYGHYYAAQAMHQYKHVDNRAWERWEHLNRVHFLKMQQSNGAWIDEVGGFNKEKNAYATGMACLILSIPRGYLPIFQT
ncbi:MAG: prenyltransferase/squalene oxidase repeat-containing protein [Planctomycetota bacterium]|jgi:hypothetical protein